MGSHTWTSGSQEDVLDPAVHLEGSLDIRPGPSQHHEGAHGEAVGQEGDHHVHLEQDVHRVGVVLGAGAHLGDQDEDDCDHVLGEKLERDREMFLTLKRMAGRGVRRRWLTKEMTAGKCPSLLHMLHLDYRLSHLLAEYTTLPAVKIVPFRLPKQDAATHRGMIQDQLGPRNFSDQSCRKEKLVAISKCIFSLNCNF